MAERYQLTPNQIAVLRALNNGIVEMSPLEVAVGSLLLPDQARSALEALQGHGLAHSWQAGQSGESMFELTTEGQTVVRALAQFQGTPPIGSVVRLPPSLRSFKEWFTRRERSSVEIVPND